MAHAYYHAKSSARKFGGMYTDYLWLHEAMDESKSHLADARHRLVFHHSFGIFIIERIVGKSFVRASDGKEMPTRPILEQHVLEDLGFIPTLEQALTGAGIEVEPWMHRRAKQLSREEDQKEGTSIDDHNT